MLGGVIVDTGDFVVGDADGVVVIKAENVAACLQAAHERGAKEARFFEQLRAGASTVELLGLDVSSIWRGASAR